jgi:Tfp pilus assembly protein PilF
MEGRALALCSLLIVSGCAAELRALQAGAAFDRACALDVGGQLDAAAEAYRASLDAEPSASAANNLGVITAKRHDVEGARRWFAYATSIDEHDIIARTNLGVVLYHLGRGNDAADELRQARQIRRDAIERLLPIGRVNWDADAYAAATERADQVAAKYLARLGRPATVQSPPAQQLAEVLLPSRAM